MNDRLPIKPSPALLAATRRALLVLARHWPTKFKAVHGSSDQDEAFVADYAKACAYVALDALEDAALAWVARSKFAPTPAEFGDIARELRPPLAPRAGAAPDVPALAKDGDRVDLLARRAFRALGSWRKVADVWSLLWLTATTADERDQVREGRVPDDLFEIAVQKIAGGYVPASSGPLGRVAV